MKLTKLYQKSPYLYFILVGFIIAIPNMLRGIPNSYIVLVLCLPFVYQIFKERKDLNILLGILMMMWSLWMSLAFLSDAIKIQSLYSTKAILVFAEGGLFTALNIWMSARLFTLAVHNSTMSPAMD